MDFLPPHLAELYAARQWYQLTQQLFLLSPIQTHNVWPAICEFSDRLNQISLVLLAQRAISHLDSYDARVFLQKLQIVDQQAGLLLCISIASQCLQTGNIQQGFQILSKAHHQIENLTDLEPVLYSQLYRQLALAHKAKQNPQLFYRFSLQFLAYTPPQEVQQAEKLAYELGVAAILAENIYNIGELVDQPIIKSLESTGNSWLFELLHSFSQGDIKVIEERLTAVPDELKDEVVIRKARILCLMEYIFQNTVWVFSFGDLSGVMNVDLDQVEWVLMKAMALGLIQGEIDEVEQSVKVSYLQPKVLDMARISLLQDRIGVWKSSINDVLNHLEEQSKEILEQVMV